MLVSLLKATLRDLAVAGAAGGGSSSGQQDELLDQLLLVIEDTPLLQANSRMCTNLALIMPPLMCGQTRLCDALVEHFRGPVDTYLRAPDDPKVR